MLNFAFTGGGATTVAITFDTRSRRPTSRHQSGGLTKIGSGDLTLSGNDTVPARRRLAKGVLSWRAMPRRLCSRSPPSAMLEDTPERRTTASTWATTFTGGGTLVKSGNSGTLKFGPSVAVNWNFAPAP